MLHQIVISRYKCSPEKFVIKSQSSYNPFAPLSFIAS